MVTAGGRVFRRAPCAAASRVRLRHGNIFFGLPIDSFA
jgi:hypothetical protein